MRHYCRHAVPARDNRRQKTHKRCIKNFGTDFAKVLSPVLTTVQKPNANYYGTLGQVTVHQFLARLISSL